MPYPSNQRILLVGKSSKDSSAKRFKKVLQVYLHAPHITIASSIQEGKKCYKDALDTNCYDLVITTAGTSKEFVKYLTETSAASKLITEKDGVTPGLERSRIAFEVAGPLDCDSLEDIVAVDTLLDRLYKKHKSIASSTEV